MYNLIEAGFRKGEINHVAGDAHYLVYALPAKTSILTIHDCNILVRYRGLKRVLLKWLWFRIPIARAAFVTTISRFTLEELVKRAGCSPHNLRVVYDAVSPEFRPVIKEFNQECPVILQVGTAWNKNLERVAEAIAGLECSLYVVGELTDEQRSLLTALGVKFLGGVRVTDDELVRLYQYCDIVVFASVYEGFGLPIVEAQACGKPVVTSRLGSMPEVAGGAALLVDPYDVRAIRDSLVTLIRDPQVRLALVADGLRNVERFRGEVIAADFKRVYDAVRVSR